MKPRSSRLLRYLLILVVLVAAAFAIRHFAFPPAPPAPPPTVAVTRADIESTVLASGTLQAQKMVSVGAQVSGQIKTLAVELGDTVTQGQLIAEIDSVPQRNALRNAEAALATVQAQQRAQQASLKQAELAFQRQRQLLAQNAASRQDFEQAEATQATVRAQIAALDAQISQARITVDTAKVNLGYTRITAPMDGTVVALVTQEGQTVNANQQAPTIIKLAQLDTLTVTAQISEADVIRVKPGQKVYFTILGEPDKRHYATLRAVEPAPESVQSESSSSASSSSSSASSAAVYYNGLFDIPNPDNLLRIAMTAQVYIILAEATDALRIPVAALRNRSAANAETTVQVLDANGEVVPRQIRVGLNNNIDAQVLEGLAEGDRVVMRGAGAGGAAGGMAGGQGPGQQGQRRTGPPMRM